MLKNYYHTRIYCEIDSDVKQLREVFYEKSIEMLNKLATTTVSPIVIEPGLRHHIRFMAGKSRIIYDLRRNMMDE